MLKRNEIFTRLETFDLENQVHVSKFWSAVRMREPKHFEGVGLKLILSLVLLLNLTAAAWGDEQVEPIEEVFEPAGTFDPEAYGMVAVVQWANPAPTPIDVTKEQAESFKQGGLKTLESYIEQAAGHGAKLILTPEFATVGYPDIPELPSEEDQFQNREQVAPYVEKVGGPSTQFFSKLAKRLKVAIHFGMAEVDPDSDLYYNTVVALDADGEMVASYRKLHLFNGETKFLEAGESPVTYRGDFGLVGLAICSDIYSDPPMANYKEMGVNMVALSTSWAQYNTGMDHFKQAARRTRAFVLAANQNYFPDSGVVNPDGTTQSHIRQSTGIAYGHLPYARSKKR